MTETELVKKIQILKNIKPRKDWVILAKIEILGEGVNEQKQPSANFVNVIGSFFQKRMVYAYLTAALLMVSAIGFAQDALPGDILYSVKKISEKGRAVFVSEREQPRLDLEYANRRLDELSTIAKTNQVKKLAPAITELQANASQAAKNISKMERSDVKDIMAQAKMFEKNKKEIEKVLATKIGTEDLDNALAKTVEGQFNDLINRTLTDSQKELLEEAREDYKEEHYTAALEKILLLNNLSEPEAGEE